MQKSFTAAKLDRDTLRLLDVIAEENEGNRSQTIRKLIREAAKARGLQSEAPDAYKEVASL